MNDFCLQRACLQFISELASPLIELRDKIGGTLSFCYQQAQIERMRTLAMEAVLCICEYTQTCLKQEEITPLFTFVQTTYQHLSQEHASKLIQAAGIIASVQDDSVLGQAIEEISK